tara:strand:+ start:243 stop:530 length:288 start_codon:yes stop_codon:yes gene_type:complete
MGRKGIGKVRDATDIDNAQLYFIASILSVVKVDPYYAMCECARGWANTGGIDIQILYEQARKGTDYSTVPFRIMNHEQWAKIGRKIKKEGVKVLV